MARRARGPSLPISILIPRTISNLIPHPISILILRTISNRIPRPISNLTPRPAPSDTLK